jgi:hypothetical protein
VKTGDETKSPWTAIPRRSPFVLPQDWTPVEAFNRRAAPEHRIDVDVLPEPFIGPWDAPLVLLSLNPGWDPEDREVHARSEVDAVIRRNLAGGATSFYYLDEVLRDTPGGRWWRKRVARIIDAAGPVAARRMLVVEYFPYHTAHFHRSTPRVPSRAFALYLVREAMRRDAWVICMRARNAWLEAIPELASHSRFGVLKNPQNVTVSPGNFDRFTEMVETVVRDNRTEFRFPFLGGLRRTHSPALLFDPVDDYNDG